MTDSRFVVKAKAPRVVCLTLLACLTLIASLAIASTLTVEVVGYTDEGEYVRLRGVMLGASYVGCPTGPCLNVDAIQITLAFDSMFSDGFDGQQQGGTKDD